MITSEIYDSIIDQISEEIDKANNANLIVVKKEQREASFEKNSAKSLYEQYHNGLSVNISESQEQIIFSERFITLEEYYYGLCEIKTPLSTSEIKQKIIETKDSYNVASFLSDFLSSKLSFVPHTLTEQINKKKNSYLFPCCDDEAIILQSLINYYSEVINSPDKQINFFSSDLQLNKTISDLLALGIVKIMEKTLEFKRPKGQNTSINKLPEHNKIDERHKLIWLGKQKELLELIIELQEKGWINEIPTGSIKKAADSICRLFDLTGTKKSDDTDEVKSFEQNLKGEMIDGKRVFDNIFGKRYHRKFNHIKKNE